MNDPKPLNHKESLKKLGFFGESLAKSYLERQGYEIIAQNYTKPWGEIDLIARQGEVYVFVEVKTNSKEFSGNFSPELRVNHHKLSNITKTAMLFLEYEAKAPDAAWQVDIIALTINLATKKARLKHFKNIATALF